VVGVPAGLGTRKTGVLDIGNLRPLRRRFGGLDLSPEATEKNQPQCGVRQAEFPVPYEVRWEPHGVYSRYYGNVTGDDMRRHIEEVCKDDRFERHRYNILDFSDATDFNPSERELLINSGVLIGAAFTNHQVLIAAVVTRENIRAALERFQSLGVSPYEAKIFSTVAEARKWIEESGFASRRYSVA